MTGWKMRPMWSTFSTLGVFAIVSVIIATTASEAESSSDRPTVDEERTSNETIPNPLAILSVVERANETDGSTSKDFTFSSGRVDPVNVSQLQADQGDTYVVHTDVEADDVNRQPNAEATTVERANTTDRRVLDDVQVDDEGVSNTIEHGDDEADHRDLASTTSSVTETRLVKQKVVEDIRAISFQVPFGDADEEKGKGEETRKGGSKSTKAFYEIKPSIKTEMERSHDHQMPTTTQKSLAGRKFVIPSVDSAFGKFGPYFEDGDEEKNITARIGSTVLLDCKIGMLGDKKVTWLQHGKDSFRLLTVGMTPYSVDQRISLNFRYPSNWRLQILYASPRDSGLYKCQVATHPPLVKKINVIVTAPELTITDDSGRVVAKERHLKAGSALKLRCEARDVLESLKESVVWTRGDETLTEDVSENRTTEYWAGKEVVVIVSTLVVERASPRHAGNYSCLVPGKANSTIAVHVLNGELPAAVHDGNGVSRAFLNLWLIHLTMSYVFSR